MFSYIAGSDFPTKCVSREVTLEVKCSVNFIDFEGRSDGESIKKLITQVKPRQLVSLVPRAARCGNTETVATSWPTLIDIYNL